MSTIIPQSSGTSPFDAIRQVRPDGSEFWSARTLMPLLGYRKWERFADAVAQARSVIEAEDGLPAADREASRCREAFGRTRQVGDDFHLSRRASYLTAMRGDSRKDEVRKALVYFATKTREAELAQAAPLDEIEVAERYVAALKANRTLKAENAELAATNAKLSPKARVAEQYEANKGVTPTVFHKTWFPEVRHSDFFEHLYRRDYLIDQRNTRWNERKQEWKDGPEHGHPAAKGKRYFYLDPQLDRNGVRRQHTRVRAGDAGHDLVAALERDGLPSRQRPAIPGADVLVLRAGGAA